jgi:hypothetical protein
VVVLRDGHLSPPRIGTPVRNLTTAATFVGPRPAIGYAVCNQR